MAVLVAKCGITLDQRIFGLVSVGIFYLLPACVVVLVAKCGITLGKCIFGLGIGRTLLLIACLRGSPGDQVRHYSR